MLDNGDSTLIITPKGKKILIDGGEEQNILVPYLLARKIKKIDYIIISHFDSDHVGGILTVIEKLNVKTIIISKQTNSNENYEAFKQIVMKRHINVVNVKTGDKINIEKNVYFSIIWPGDISITRDDNLNNNSLVCKLNHGNFSILFTGDIENVAESKILENDKNLLNSTILKVAHHGSNSSSTEKFIKAVNPQIALIGVGQNNKFGHPNKVVLERLENIRN